MAETQEATDKVAAENRRLKALVAQLQDRLDHLADEQSVADAMKSSAKQVADLEEMQQVVLQSMSDVVLMTSGDGRFEYVSPNVHLIFGHALPDVLRHGHIGFLLPATLFDLDVLESRGEISNLDCTVRDSIGRDRQLLVSVRSIQSSHGTILYTVRDVTERKRLESDLALHKMSLDRKVQERTEELRKSREHYRRLVEGLQDEYFFYTSDAEGVISYVSPSIHSMLGYTPKEVVGRNWREFCNQDSKLFAECEELEKHRFAGLSVPVHELELIHSDGDMRLIQLRDYPVFDDDGAVVLNEGIARDVTARRNAEEKLQQTQNALEHRVEERTTELREMYERLRDSESRYRSVVEDSPDFIVRWNGDGIRTFVNDAYCHYLGQTPEEILGTSFLPSIYEADREALAAKIATVSATSPVISDEHRYVLPNGRVVWQRWSNRALFDLDGTLQEFQSVGCDVTERRAAESRTREKAIAEARIAILSNRECEVMQYVVSGNANKVIARRLDLSIKTIEKHRSSLMRKLQVRSVPELVRLAMLVDTGESAAS